MKFRRSQESLHNIDKAFASRDWVETKGTHIYYFLKSVIWGFNGHLMKIREFWHLTSRCLYRLNYRQKHPRVWARFYISAQRCAHRISIGWRYCYQAHCHFVTIHSDDRHRLYCNTQWSLHDCDCTLQHLEMNLMSNKRAKFFCPRSGLLH
jgi:hypothetical protein